MFLTLPVTGFRYHPVVPAYLHAAASGMFLGRRRWFAVASGGTMKNASRES